MAPEMRETTYLILTALAGGPLHGYAIIGDVKAISDHRVTLRAGSLYGALDRLVAEGLVREKGEEIVGGRLRRYYQLTERGGTDLAAEAQRLAARSHEALRRLNVSPRPA